ncbi:hypothetical protein UVI_02030040 [Ustilaginoidea virens]|uniref:Domain of unknown function at the cortex 1 domain-containing protein n=1 Tax=Ustilaginoidea virens TaxID=1159556 RepID=A0A1B5L343_USTVR|nr:hypothetical protein UVI_02030040 [Ustilaginoidea virens]
MTDKYMLRVTAGPSYDASTHVQVPVNRPQPVRISSLAAHIELNVRIQNYNGLPPASPATSPYFSTEPHAYNQDQYSICFRFTPRDQAPAVSPGPGTGFGNDFDRPIRDRLPPGFNTALSIVRWWIDPGLEGDAYADRPYLYGPALSSFNLVHIGAGEYDEQKGGLWFDEGGDEQGLQAREAVGAPADGKARMKWALRDDSKSKWVFEYGKTYGLDFFNPYLDFAKLSLKLPGFHLPIVKYWDGQGLRRSHELRYVLRNKQTGETYLVVVFTIYLREDVNEDGTLKDGATERVVKDVDGAVVPGEHDEEKAFLRAGGEMAPEADDTRPDDVD